MKWRGCLAGLTAAAVLCAPGAAGATPTCPGPDRSACGGRIIPEPSRSTGFLTYDEWIGAMQQLQREHPNRVRFHQIGRTAGGRPLYDVWVSNFSAPTPLGRRVGLYFNGDIHGDERDGTEGFARVIEDLADSSAPATLRELGQEVLVFTDANPDGWQSGDVPGGVGGNDPQGPTYTRQNGAGHDLNREWPVVGFQNPDTFPLTDPEIRSLVQAEGNVLHRAGGLRFAYGFDVHGSATPETPPNSQLMLDVLLSAGQFDLTRSLEQVQMFDTYMKRLSATTSDNVLANIGGSTNQQVYRVGAWDTSWDIYGYLVSGGYADWMANQTTGLGAVTGTIELWINGEPGQENTFAGFNQPVEAANVHSMRVVAATAMDLATRNQRGLLDLPGRVAWVPNGFKLRAAPSTPVGDPATRPPVQGGPASTNGFFTDLARDTSRPLVRIGPRSSHRAQALKRFRAIVVAQDAHLADPAFIAALRRYARAGGTVVLTDGALRALAGMGLVPASAIGMQKVYAGYVDPARPGDPLLRGARPLSRQTYEPVPIGYLIDNAFSSASSRTTSPVWTIDSNAFAHAGGRTVGTTGDGRTSLGELPVGRGRVRILGALLPDPSAAFNHPFGVAGYAVTYWGYQLLANMLGGSERLR